MRAVPLAIIACALCTHAVDGQVAVRETASTPMQTLSRMAGCWRQDTSAGAAIDEMWMAPAAGMMLGTSRTSARGRVVAYEFMRIRSDDSGVTFFAQLPNQPETTFRMIRIDADAVVFENAKHDFPQRVIYRIGSDLLTGRIEGTENGTARSVEYPMRRVACA